MQRIATLGLLVAVGLMPFTSASGQMPAPTELNLVCNGQYQDTESSTGETSTYKDGKWQSGSVTVTTEVMRDGVANFEDRGDSADLTIPMTGNSGFVFERRNRAMWALRCVTLSLPVLRV